MNWYKESKTKNISKKPYNIIKTCWGKEVDTQIEIEAYSSRQARIFALRRHSVLYDYLEAGCIVEARLNKYEWERRQKVEEESNQREEDMIQNAWWQD